jgi:hypothetical protein
MAVTEPAPAFIPAPWRQSGHTRGHAFGLDVDAAFDIPALGSTDDRPSSRRTVCRELSVRELERDWPAAESEAAVELRYPDGRLFMSIRRHPDLGYRIWAPHHGRHVVSSDGTEIRSALPRRAVLAWQRLFFAQTLPLAAALQGLEVLHASAVGIAGRAVAFTAASGTGKSSVAAHLVASGASFLTDDVLALEHVNDEVLAHAGPARASVASQELRAMTPLGRARLGKRVGATDKPHFEPAPTPSPLPLAILYRVIRSPLVGQPQFREHAPPPARLVLASSFLPYLRTRERMLNQLAICARVTTSVRLFDFEIPAQVSARAAAALSQAHLEDVLST